MPVFENIDQARDYFRGDRFALENGITIRALKEMNGLKKDNVRVGQKLKVPAEKPAAEKKAEPAKKPAEAKPEAVEAPAPAPETEKPAEVPVDNAANK